MTQKETITPGKYVELGYDLYVVAPDGSEQLMHQTDNEDPEKIIFGITQGMIVPLEKAIEGLSAGDEFDVVAKCNEAFGPRDDDQIAELDRDIFLVDGKFDAETICEGAVVPMMTADGYRISGIVLQVTADKVKMDFNHPLAGKDIRFKGHIITVRQATPEELQPSCGCGGGCGGGCGDGGCNCGDGGCK
jgi:FKBP-type peptidyl-prolyl cis-trans isomerase SlyD